MNRLNQITQDYLPPVVWLIRLDAENAVLMSSNRSALAEDLKEFEIGYDD